MRTDCCELHKNGRYQKWPCGVYSKEKRHETYVKNKDSCPCGQAKSSGAKMCLPCSAKKRGEARRGSKLPDSWKLNISLSQRKESHPQWKGDDAGYSAIHKWLYKNITKRDSCDVCGTVKNVQYANISGEYKREPDDWSFLCPKHHKEFDSDTVKKFTWNGKVMVKN